MAKKKNQNRKHKFKYSEPTAQVGSSVSPTQSTPAPVKQKQPVMAMAGGAQTRDFSYVAKDVKRITIIAAFLVLLELILWVVLGNSDFGKGIYSLIKV
jgi:hypothetical protein